MQKSKVVVVVLLGLVIAVVLGLVTLTYVNRDKGLLITLEDGKKVYLPDAVSYGLDKSGFEYAKDAHGDAFISLSATKILSVVRVKDVPSEKDALMITEADCENYDREQKQKELTRRKK